MCVIFIKSVLYNSVVVRYISDEYEEPYECLSVIVCTVIFFKYAETHLMNKKDDPVKITFIFF